MTVLYHGKLTPANVAGSATQAGFGPSNLALEALGRNVRFADATAGHFATINLAAAQTVMAIFLHDVNFAACEIWKSADGVNFFFVGIMTTYADRHGRRRGLAVINDANVKAVKFIITAVGATTDGLAYWRAGAGHLFASKTALAVAPVYPLPVRTKRPRISTTIPNGVPSVASTGLNIDRVTLNFMPRDIEALDTFIQKTTAGVCVLDTEYSPYPAQIWPVRMLEEDFEETHTGKRLSTFQAIVTEAIASP